MNKEKISDLNLTPEQEEKFIKAMEEVETSKIFICTECNEKLTGMKEVREHNKNKQHYSYKNPGCQGQICFLG